MTITVLHELDYADIEHIEIRNSSLSAQTIRTIAQVFGGDVQLAEQTAKQLRRTQREIPEWATELAGPTAGWQDPQAWRVN